MRLYIEHRSLPDGEWPGPRPLRTWEERPWAPFTASWSSTLKLLDRELYRLDAYSVVLSTAHKASAIRRDGMLRNDAGDPVHPGVVLTFETPDKGSLRYATDIFDRKGTLRAWQCNVRAIALGLEALRKVDRYGITGDGEQYRGFSALPSGLAMGAPLSVIEAARILADLTPEPYDAGDLLVDEHTAHVTSVRVAYKKAAAVHHPDAGGDAQQWDALERAYRRLTEGA